MSLVLELYLCPIGDMCVAQAFCMLLLVRIHYFQLYTFTHNEPLAAIHAVFTPNYIFTHFSPIVTVEDFDCLQLLIIAQFIHS